MKKLFILVGVLLITASTINAQELTLEQILDKHYKAVGLDKLQNVKTIIMSGSMTTNVIMPLKIIKARPNKYRMERDVVDITGLSVFDGQNGWSPAPWTRNPNPQVVAGPALIDLQIQSDFDGLLYNWSTKGHKAELVGKEKIAETDVFKIKLTRKDGGIEYYLIDCNSFLLIRKLGYRTMRGQEVELENNFSDYRIIDGVMFSFQSINKVGGQQSSEIQYDTIELNQTVDDNIFVMPAK